MKKVAWYVESEDQSDIIFAESAEKAIARCSVWGSDVITAKREPNYDQFVAFNYVPSSRLILDGYRLPCECCEAIVDEENEQEDEAGEVYYPAPVFKDDKAFCSTDCFLIWSRKHG